MSFDRSSLSPRENRATKRSQRLELTRVRDVFALFSQLDSESYRPNPVLMLTAKLHREGSNQLT